MFASFAFSVCALPRFFFFFLAGCLLLFPVAPSVCFYFLCFFVKTSVLERCNINKLIISVLYSAGNDLVGLGW